MKNKPLDAKVGFILLFLAVCLIVFVFFVLELDSSPNRKTEYISQCMQITEANCPELYCEAKWYCDVGDFAGCSVSMRLARDCAIASRGK